MCILFFYLNPNAEEGRYQLILANNRDEFYTRPTKPAEFWGENNDCISGIDVMSQREGGTWLGASKRGRIGVLLNILTETGPLPDKRARGHLVTNYLTGEQSAAEYLQPFRESGPEYNKFNLLLIDLNAEEKIHYYCNDPDEGEPKSLPAGTTYGLSNSPLNKPFKKTSCGKERFSCIVQKSGSTDQKAALTEKLWDLMADETSYLPDEQMKKQGGKELQGDLYRQRAAVYVNSSAFQYGTRTTTILLVDHSGKCEYLEKTMREPIDASNPVWDLTSHSFNMQQNIKAQSV